MLVGYRRNQIGHPLDGFGFVVPEIENRRILAAASPATSFPAAHPSDCVLLRVFVGGARHPELVELNDEELRQIVLEELREILSTQGDPLLFQVTRWRNAMPQYHLGHKELVRADRRPRRRAPRPRAGRQRLSRRRHSRLHSQRGAGAKWRAPIHAV